MGPHAPGNNLNRFKPTWMNFWIFYGPPASLPSSQDIKQCQNLRNRALEGPYRHNGLLKNSETWIDVLVSLRAFERYLTRNKRSKKVQNRDIVSTTFHAMRCPGQIWPNRPVCLLHEGKV